jgi:hypothetical protein
VEPDLARSGIEINLVENEAVEVLHEV